jgi:dynein heavy chain, axonemal
MYSLLETYHPEIIEKDKDENEDKTYLKRKWGELVKKGESTRNEVQYKQAEFKKSLIEGIKKLITEVQQLRTDFEKNGPMVQGISPREANTRLRTFAEQYTVTRKKYESFHSGETLFGLPHQAYPALETTRSEIELLDQLYKLYEKVLETIGKWKDVHWSDIREEIDNMIETIELMSKQCKKLPGPLKSWEAYKELQTEIDNMNEMLPIIKELAKPSIRDRHWNDVCKTTSKEIPFMSESFVLNDLLKANLIKFLDDI